VVCQGPGLLAGMLADGLVRDPDQGIWRMADGF
jgi:hypothetical protein